MSLPFSLPYFYAIAGPLILSNKYIEEHKLSKENLLPIYMSVYANKNDKGEVFIDFLFTNGVKTDQDYRKIMYCANMGDYLLIKEFIDRNFLGLFERGYYFFMLHFDNDKYEEEEILRLKKEMQAESLRIMQGGL